MENPLNNLFTLRWRFQTGTGHDLNLLMLDDWMEYGGCDTLDYQALKKALQKLGGSLSFNLDVQDFTVTLEGPEEALPELLTLLNQKMSLPTLSEKERTAVINSRKSERERYIKGQPQVIIITGNRKKIDLAAIEKLYGPVVEHKFKDIYRE